MRLRVPGPIAGRVLLALVGAAAALLVVVLGMSGVPVTAQDEPAPIMWIDPPHVDARRGETKALTIRIRDAPRVQGFELALQYDRAGLGLDFYEMGSFLTSTGRRAQVLGPRHYPEIGYWSVGAALLPGDQPVPEGDGDLVRLEFVVRAEGCFAVNLLGDRARLVPEEEIAPGITPTVRSAMVASGVGTACATPTYTPPASNTPEGDGTPTPGTPGPTTPAPTNYIQLPIALNQHRFAPQQ